MPDRQMTGCQHNCSATPVPTKRELVFLTRGLSHSAYSGDILLNTRTLTLNRPSHANLLVCKIQ
jgi:hypothetical protein